MRHINVALTDDQHESLSEVKGERSWQTALLEEFGVAENE